jgi:hypothetical protein
MNMRAAAFLAVLCVAADIRIAYADPPAATSKGDAAEAADLASRRKEFWKQFQRLGGARPANPKVSKTEAFNYWMAVRSLNTGNNKRGAYAAAGKLLVTAEALLEQTDPKVRASGIGLLIVTVEGINQQLKDYALSALICELWLLPNLDAAAPDETEYVSRVNGLKTATTAYLKAGAFEPMEETARRWLEEAKSDNSRDYARLRIAQAQQAVGAVDEADATLGEISDPSMLGLRDLIGRRQR